MKEITFLEKLAEDLIEGGFARILKPRLEPVQIAKALARETDAAQMVGPDGPLVANRYSVFLHPTDFAAFSGFQHNLERELAGYIQGYAARQGLKPIGTISVHLEESTDVRPGRVRIGATMADTTQPAAPSAPPSAAQSTPPPIESTMEMPVVAVPAPPPAAPRATTPEPPRALLTNATGEEIPLVHASTAFGRAIDNDAVLEDRSVSRYHAQINWDVDHYVLEDLDSTNGTMASGKRIHRHTLLDGEEVSFGNVHFTFRLAGE